ncbi:MAG: hypothetical protein QME51_08750 [Planctomycetota bacterium]|nr:hypothetical protein [Planctomycetota bacterium]
MSEDEKDFLQKTIEDSISKSIRAELGAYKIPKEQHYLDHLFISEWREWQATTKSTAWKAVIGIMATGVSFLLYYGFLFLKGNNK